MQNEKDNQAGNIGTQEQSMKPCDTPGAEEWSRYIDRDVDVRPVSCGTERVRAWHMDLLGDCFQDFVKHANPSEIMFLADVLFAWMSCYQLERKDGSRCVIADLMLARLAPEMAA